MAGIDKTYVKTWDEYKDVLDWCDSVGIVTDDYGNKMHPSKWLYHNNLTKEDFNGNEKDFVLWNTGYLEDIYLIRHCPCKIVQERLHKVYDDEYINDVLNHNTEYDKFVRPIGDKNPKFKIIWKEKPHKKLNYGWCVDMYGSNGSIYSSDVPACYLEDWDKWIFKNDTFYCSRGIGNYILRGYLTPRKIYRKLRKWNLPKGTKLKFYGFYYGYSTEFDVVIK